MNLEHKVTNAGRWMIFVVAFCEYILPAIILMLSSIFYYFQSSDVDADSRMAEVGTPLLYLVCGIWLFRFLLEVFPLCLVFFHRSYRAAMVLFVLHLPIWIFGAVLVYCAIVQIPERADSIHALLSLLVLLGVPIFLYVTAIRCWVTD